MSETATICYPVCEECGQVTLVALRPHDHLTVACDVCIAEYDSWHCTCPECGDSFHVEEHSDNEDIPYCPDCVEKMKTCEDCGEVFFPNRHYRPIGGNDYCEDCVENYTVCDECGNAVHCDHAMYANDGENTYCGDRCYSRNCSYCSDCETEYPRGESCNCEPEDEEPEYTAIRSYSYKPRWRLIGAGPHAGAEIEMECDSRRDINEDAHRASEILGDYCATVKEDGSISTSRGFEVVTEPISLSKWSEVPLREFCANLTGKGYKSHDTDTCGLHVHVSRSHLDTPALCRIAIFVHSQRNNLEKLGRRGFNSYCKYKETLDNGLDLVRDYDRYGAINFCPTNTIEYRFPKGSLNPATILGTVQLCFAITSFCDTEITSRSLQDTDNAWTAFTEYVRGNPEYSAATTYLDKRGF